MEKLSALDYLSRNKPSRILYRIALFFAGIPAGFLNFFKKIGRIFKKFGLWVANVCKNIVNWFVQGDWKTRVSYVVMGFGSVARGQWLRGILFFVFEVVFIVYMAIYGGYYIGKFGSLGTVTTRDITDQVTGVTTTVYGDNSLLILLYGILSILFIVAFCYTWYLNIKQNHINEEIIAHKKAVVSVKDDLHALIDKDFYKTMLALPLAGILVFTVVPIIFMILVAFTSYDGQHQPPGQLFTWDASTWTTLFSFSNGQSTFVFTFGQILLWTLVWAFFATFTNYFLGMFVAMLINKKGIRLKKVWRTILVASISIPQFVLLLFVSKLFADNGIINGLLQSWGLPIVHFWNDPTLARITVIIINIWIGVPYLMLITTGILMNIPVDLYESAKIDGANAFQQYFKITLPYMLFVTGPYLLTSFIGNMNNFNVIYLLTEGGPATTSYYSGAGQTDLLITWLFTITLDNDPQYNVAAILGILVFVVVSLISLIVYNVMPSTKNEEDFA